MDWVRILKEEGTASPLLVADEIAKKYDISLPSIRKALGRQEKRGLVERITHKLYLNNLARDVSPYDLVNVLRPCAYVSLDSALRFWGISTQTTSAITCVSLGKPREYRTKSIRIVYRTIAEKLLWGFVEKQTFYGKYRLAEPEKAILDWIYLSLQEGVEPAVDELDLRSIDKQKLVRYASKYPASVLAFLVRTILLESFAA